MDIKWQNYCVKLWEYYLVLSISVFPSYLKNYVKEQLKFNVKKPISFEAHQKCDSPMLPPDKLKLQTLCKFLSEEDYILFFVSDLK